MSKQISSPAVPVSTADRGAAPWNVCDVPDCEHNGCSAKLRAWGRYGRRYICEKPGCKHHNCAAKKRARADHQPFGQYYRGPALPQHTLLPDGRPAGPAMRAIEDPPGYWSLLPLEDKVALDPVPRD
jgi:hypothetical protein